MDGGEFGIMEIKFANSVVGSDVGRKFVLFFSGVHVTPVIKCNSRNDAWRA